MTLTIALSASADALETHVDELTKLDSIVGDGDLGITAAKVAQAIRGALTFADQGPVQLLQECGKAISSSAASSCGTLLASGFLAASKAVGEGRPDEQLAAGLTAATEAMMKRGKAAAGDRTLIDALAPAAEAARLDAPPGDWPDYLGSIAAAAQGGVERTRSMRPRVGRARTQPERAEGHPDAGAVLVSVALTAALESVSGGQSE